MSLSPVVPELAHQLGLVPFAWLVALRVRGQSRGAAWWWLAGAFFVSWLADSAAHWGPPWLISVVFPISQAALVAAVLLDRDEAEYFTIALFFVGAATIVWHGVAGPDVLLSSVAFFAVTGIAWHYRAIGRVRVSLLVYFGLGQLAWIGFAAYVTSCLGERACLMAGAGWWLLYQSLRTLGIVLFCWAAVNPSPRLVLTARADKP